DTPPVAAAGEPRAVPASRAQPGRLAARYRRLLEGSGAMAFELDAAGVAVYVSAAARAVTGYAPEELLGRPLWQVLCPGPQAQAARALWERLGAGDVAGRGVGGTAKGGRAGPLGRAAAHAER